MFGLLKDRLFTLLFSHALALYTCLNLARRTEFVCFFFCAEETLTFLVFDSVAN